MTDAKTNRSFSLYCWWWCSYLYLEMSVVIRIRSIVQRDGYQQSSRWMKMQYFKTGRVLGSIVRMRMRAPRILAVHSFSCLHGSRISMYEEYFSETLLDIFLWHIFHASLIKIVILLVRVSFVWMHYALNWPRVLDRMQRFFSTYIKLTENNVLLSCLTSISKLDYDHVNLECHVSNLFNPRTMYHVPCPYS